jgi:hypothetical protein
MASGSDEPAGLRLGSYDGLELGGANPGAQMLAKLTIRRPLVSQQLAL